MRKDYDEKEKLKLQIIKYDVIKYFFDLTATFLRGMGYRKNPEFLMWVSCDADLDESNLRIAMRFFTDILPDMVGENELLLLMRTYPILSNVLASVVEMSFGLNEAVNDMIPFPISSNQTILDIAQIVLLTSFLKEEDYLYEWEMVYSSAYQGFSETLFIRCIVNKGPTIVFVKDQNGWIFGGYGSSSWMISPKFYGTDRCFLFRLVPTFKIFSSSDVNENFMYLNRGQRTMPNGLGMGGYLDYFGLWISLDRPVGRCENHCTTFENYECLSSENNFFFVDLEVWRVTERNLDTTQKNTKLSRRPTKDMKMVSVK